MACHCYSILHSTIEARLVRLLDRPNITFDTIMPAKKKLKNDSAAPQPPAPAAGDDKAEDELEIISPEMTKYFAKVQDDIDAILNQWPNIVSLDALPETGDTGFKSLIGYGSPFDPAVFDARFPEADFTYRTHVNVFWQNIRYSVLSYVPLYWERTLDLAANITKPAAIKRDMVFVANFMRGASLPRGGCIRLSPCEEIHSILHKVADRIRDGASPEELDQWLRVLLSAPCVFQKFTSGDAQYAEANSLRQDTASAAEAVTFSARQLVYNVYGFKASHEKSGDMISAEQVATFWEKEIRTSSKQKYLTKKSTIDACLTVRSRMYAIPGAEDIIAKDEGIHGVDSFWNHLWKQQEMIYRARTSKGILWLMQDLSDQLASNRITNSDVSIATLRTGAKSISDPSLARMTLKEHLLGAWLDSLNIPPYMVQKCREIFKDHASYRRLYNPIELESDAKADTTWLLKWPQFGRDIVDFLESSIFVPQTAEVHILRQAVRNNATNDEILANEPYATAVANIRTKVNATGTPEALGVAGGAPPSQTGNTPTTNNQDQSDNVHDIEKDPTELLLDQATERTMRKLLSYVEEPQSFTALRDLFASTPLAMIQPSPDSGNVLIICDCNVFGETDSRPDRRCCPIGKDKLETILRALLVARYGKEDPAELTLGEFWCCISGGKDRKRSFTKPLQTPSMKKGRDPNRLFTRAIHLHLKESALRIRKHRNKGHVTLTQQSYMTGNRESFARLAQNDYPIHGGSIATDVLGPISMDPLSSIPTMTLEEKKTYWGKRFVLAGGAVPRDGLSSDGESTNDEVAGKTEDSKYPINYHCLPVSVVVDKADGFNVKHVIDLAPTPLNLSYALASKGISYVALCASPTMKQFLKDQAFAEIRKALTNENEPVLYDPRFKGTHSPYTLQRSIT